MGLGLDSFRHYSRVFIQAQIRQLRRYKRSLKSILLLPYIREYNRRVTNKDFALVVTSPFRLDFTVWALRRRKSNIVDQWDGTKYTRIIVIDNNPIEITITQEAKSIESKIIISLQSEIEITKQIQQEASSIIQKMLGLTLNLEPFYALAKKNDVLKSLVSQFSGVKPPRFPTVFEGLINSIACQQVTLDVGIVMLNRLSVAFGMKFTQGDNVFYAFPRPIDLSEVSEEEIKKLGFSYQKARAIREIAASVINNRISLEGLENMTNKEVTEHLTSIRGIGRWSAEYVLLRGLGRLDIFPGDDVGAQNNLKRIFHLDSKPTYEEIKMLTSQWQPYAGLVYFHLLLEKLQGKGVI